MNSTFLLSLRIGQKDKQKTLNFYIEKSNLQKNKAIYNTHYLINQQQKQKSHTPNKSRLPRLRNTRKNENAKTSADSIKSLESYSVLIDAKIEWSHTF